jgi:hypothetical protein
MNIFTKLIRKLFLVKEIVSKKGEVHFRRFRIYETEWSSLYIHQILKSDEDLDKHDHPWDFSSLILSGSYSEDYNVAPDFETVYHKTYYIGDIVEHDADDAHKITLNSPEVWTLVCTSGREREWGYQTPDGWVNRRRYRLDKNRKN